MNTKAWANNSHAFRLYEDEQERISKLGPQHPNDLMTAQDVYSIVRDNGAKLKIFFPDVADEPLG